MADKQDLAPEKVRIKDSYRERIFAESQQLGKSYLETLYFIVDCYFAFKRGAFPMQQQVAVPYTPTFTSITTEQNKQEQPTPQPSTQETQQDSDSETFTLDFDL
ncbi:hypothetical protein FNW02_35605 [Komarekiella sp. 'clone 1']|uniref:Uncharacterized protein n=1 Tax=Komarekiella delphini-convector SJRDD-AB1 TaxID=2593771 RepID=A0AA40T4S7_9NOST|nr:hypothetical protein [Komarekiella delphini-convector]MBD6620914.1 hypothetical protein [Komarekiella delphini-convector SJRDD-AB1]